MLTIISKVITFIFFLLVCGGLIVPSVLSYMNGDEIFALILGSALLAGIIMCPQLIIMYCIHAAETKKSSVYFLSIQIILLLIWAFGFYEMRSASRPDPQSGLALIGIPILQICIVAGAVILHKMTMIFKRFF